MNSSKVILDKIISDNQKIIDENIQKAQATANEIIETAENEKQKAILDYKQTEKATYDEIIRRRVTVAKLDAKKLLMNARRQAVDNLFGAAKSQILAYDTKKYLELIANMLKKYAEDGDIVIICEADSKRITAKFVDEQAKALGIKLGFSKEFGSFEGGIILRGKACDKNLSLDVELASLREQEETQIAKMLFEE